MPSPSDSESLSNTALADLTGLFLCLVPSLVLQMGMLGNEFRARVGPQNALVNTGTSVVLGTRLLTSERVGKHGKKVNYGYINE